MIKVCFIHISGKLKECVESVSRGAQRFSRKFEGCFIKNYWAFQECFKALSCFSWFFEDCCVFDSLFQRCY